MLHISVPFGSIIALPDVEGKRHSVYEDGFVNSIFSTGTACGILNTTLNGRRVFGRSFAVSSFTLRADLVIFPGSLATKKRVFQGKIAACVGRFCQDCACSMSE